MKAKRFRVLGTLLIFAVLSMPGICEDKISVVILTGSLPTDAGQFCKATIETKYQSFRNLKINGKAEVRVEPVPSDGHPQPVTRQEYEHTKTVALKDLTQLEVRDGVLYGLSGNGETLLLLPQDRKPDKNSAVALTDLYKVSIEGQSPQPKSKDKQNLSFQDVWKIFNLNPNDKVESAIFLHVAQENKPAFWKGYLKNIPDFKLLEAIGGLRDSLSHCVDDSLAAFANGNYPALQDAESEAREAKSVDESSITQDLVARVESEKKRFGDLVAQASTLTQSGKWDEALATLDPINKYVGQFAELDAVFSLANDKSYDTHLQAGKDNLQRNVLADALAQFEIALTRKPESPEAFAGRKEALIRKTISDSRQLRQQKKPGNAREQILGLISSDASAGEDTRISAELKLASCEFGGQMLSEAQKLVLAPTRQLKPLTTVTEKSYIAAYDALSRAKEACTSTSIASLVDQVRKRLSDFHLEHARRAESRGAFGTALLYSRTAMQYAPESEATSVADRMSRTVQDNLRVHVGIIVQDATAGGSCQSDVQYFTQTLQSQLSSDFTVLDDSQTQTLSRTPQAQRPVNHVLLVGQVQYCSIQRNTRDQQVPSKYRVQNPDYENIKNSEQAAEQQYKGCRSTYGEANCGNAKSNFDAIKAQRRNTQEWLWYDYNYTSRLTLLRGSLAFSLQLLSASGSKRFGPFQQQIQDQCLEEVDIRDDDMTKVGWLGTFSPVLQQVLQSRAKSHCPLNEDEQYKVPMQQSIEQSLKLNIPEQIGRVPREYLKYAREASNQQVALDNYVMFLLSLIPKGADEKEEAIKFIKLHDNDLQLEGLTSPPAEIQAIQSDQTAAAGSSGSSANEVTSSPASLRDAKIANSEGADGPRPIVRKSSSQLTRSHPYNVALSYPANWEVHELNGFLAITPPEGFTGGAVSYGLVLGHASFANGQSFDKAAQSLTERVLRVNPGLHTSGNPTAIQINGVQGRSIHLTGVSPIQKDGQPLVEHDWLVILPRASGGLRYVVFAAPESDFDKFQPTYQDILNSLHIN